MKLQTYYCKSLKKTGKPIVVRDLEKGTEKTVSRLEYRNVNVKMSFQNSTGRAKRRGATTVLEITRD